MASPAITGTPVAKTHLGANVVTVAGIGLIGYGLMFLYRNFNGFIELGLSPAQVGGTPEQIQAYSPHLYHYISHLQVAVAAFIIALGVAVVLLAWHGIRSGQRWALWTAFVTPVIGVGIALPLHYMYGFATMGHLGLIYLDAGILLAGTILGYRELAA
jgi:phosphoglycerol transferase MdoB-like AlkP superfamily enzyme